MNLYVKVLIVAALLAAILLTVLL